MRLPHAGDMSETALVEALATADVHPLLVAVAHLTGDFSILRRDLAPDQLQMLLPGRGLSAQQEAEARRLAADALRAFAATGGGGDGVRAVSTEELRDAFGFLIGPSLVDRWTDFLSEELALEGTDPRAPTWHTTEVTVASERASGSAAGSIPVPAYTCAIIGAGVSGLAAAYRLRQAGVAVTVFEKNDDVGGTWLENIYPGCRVDVPNQLYSLSFAQITDWVSRFSAQPDLLAYLQRVTKDLELGDLIQFSTEALEAVFDEDSAQWVLTVRGPDGTTRTERFSVLVSAVGQLNRPSFPAIAGRERFKGQSFHSAAWDRDVELTGKRVAVIGTGASAAQFVPCVVDEVAHLDLYQRTPPWLLPTDNYGDPFPAAFYDLVSLVPTYCRWDRVWQFWIMHEGLLPAAKVDPNWNGGDFTTSVSAGNEFVRSMLVDVLRAQVPDDELFEKMVPRFPPFAKRALRDDGRWAAACSQPHVDLITTTIEEITPSGVRTVDKVEHPADVIIYGTGFSASSFVAPLRVVGTGGVELNEAWAGDASAYLGVSVPGFPNFFMLYGPNTNLVINGSIIVVVECQVRYVVESLGQLWRAGRRSMAVKADVHDRYSDEMEAGNALMSWGVADVPTWYRNAKGRVTQNWPFDLHTYWARTLTPDLHDYDLT
jgi:4-hydroxyacetophenone monooxygenase